MNTSESEILDHHAKLVQAELDATLAAINASENVRIFEDLQG